MPLRPRFYAGSLYIFHVSYAKSISLTNHGRLSQYCFSAEIHPVVVEVLVETQRPNQRFDVLVKFPLSIEFGHSYVNIRNRGNAPKPYVRKLGALS